MCNKYDIDEDEEQFFMRNKYKKMTIIISKSSRYRSWYRFVKYETNVLFLMDSVDEPCQYDSRDFFTSLS